MPTTAAPPPNMDIHRHAQNEVQSSNKPPPPRSASFPRLDQKSNLPQPPQKIKQSASHPTNFPTINRQLESAEEENQHAAQRWTTSANDLPRPNENKRFDQENDNKDNKSNQAELLKPTAKTEERSNNTNPWKGQQLSVPIKVRRLLGLPLAQDSMHADLEPSIARSTPTPTKGFFSTLKSMASAAFKPRPISSSSADMYTHPPVGSPGNPISDNTNFHQFNSEPRASTSAHVQFSYTSNPSEPEVEFQLMHNVSTNQQYRDAQQCVDSGALVQPRKHPNRDSAIDTTKEVISDPNVSQPLPQKKSKILSRGASVIFDGLDWDIRTIPQVLRSMKESDEERGDINGYEKNCQQRQVYSDYYHNAPHMYQSTMDKGSVSHSLAGNDPVVLNKHEYIDPDQVFQCHHNNTRRQTTGYEGSYSSSSNNNNSRRIPGYRDRVIQSTDSCDLAHCTAEILAIPARNRIAHLQPTVFKSDTLKSTTATIKSVRFDVSSDDDSIRSLTGSSYRTESTYDSADVNSTTTNNH